MIRVLIVDDSAVVRQVLGGLLAAQPGIELMHAVSDPLLAMDRMKTEWPDVIVLDVDMPRMDGITFLRMLMQERPTPVVILSSLTEQGAQTTVEALAAGAVAVVAKPRQGVKSFLEGATAELVAAVRSAAQAKVARPVLRTPRGKLSADVILPAGPAGSIYGGPRPSLLQVVALGTSTGGTQALEEVLTGLAVDCPPLLIVQHMPEKFTAAFAARLDMLCEIEVREAANGDTLRTGLALIAPGGRHMLLRSNAGALYVDVMDGPPVNRHKPSVDVLFRSVAKIAGASALGVIMTGMGDDGAAGLREMHDAGARTVAQNEASCVVFGMPKEAIKRGAVDRVVPLTHIAEEITECAREATR